MRLIDRYLAWAVIGGTLLTLGILLPLLGVVILADDLDNIGTANYTLTDALLFMALSLPRYAYQIFPIATLIGALIGLGALANRSELVAMRAAGLSVWQIVFAGLRGGVLLAVLALVLGEIIAPITEQRGVQLRRQALSGEVAQQTPDGFWAVDEGAYVNIREIQSGTDLRDIFIYQFDAGAGTLIETHASAARYRNARWVLEDIVRSRVSNTGVQTERIAQTGWDSLLDPELLKIVIADPHLLPVWGLYRYIRFMAINKQDSGAYEVVFWGKVVYPFLTLSMILLATPLLLGSSRSSGMGWRLFIGILIGILYYLISRTFAYLALLFGMNPLLAAIAPPLFFISGALLLLRRLG